MAATVAPQQQTVKAVPHQQMQNVEKQLKKKSEANNLKENGQKNGQMNGKKAKKTLTVHDWDYDEHSDCGPGKWLCVCGCEHLGTVGKGIGYGVGN